MHFVSRPNTLHPFTKECQLNILYLFYGFENHFLKMFVSVCQVSFN